MPSSVLAVVKEDFFFFFWNNFNSSPSYKLLRLKFDIQQLPKCSPVPLNTLTVFTNSSGKTGHAVIVWQDTSGHWHSDVSVVKESPQIVELTTVVKIF